MLEIGLRGAAPAASPTRSTRPRRSSTEIGLPVIIRPAYILGGRGTGIASTTERVRAASPPTGLAASPISEILIERSIAGWKEYELEVMRDRADNCVIICSIENVDPMGVHTGDSITVAPAQTLTDVEYQRDARRRVRLHPPRRRRDRRLERAVRRRPGQRRAGHHRDEPARVAVVGAGVEGHRVPDRQDRRPPRRRLHARRDPQRHHPQDAGQLRADASTTSSPRSRAGRSRSCPARPASSARRCSRSARRWRSAARSPRACRRRCARSSSGRLGLNCDPAEAAATTSSTDDELLAAVAVATPDRLFQLGRLLRRGVTVERAARRAPGSTRGSSTRCSLIVEERARAGRRPASTRIDRRDVAAGQAARLLRRPARLPVGRRRGRGARGAAGRRRAAHVQDRRHLRGRVRGRDAVPLLDLRGRGRGRARRPAARSSSSARARTASARASSSTTAACTPASPCATPATRR